MAQRIYVTIPPPFKPLREVRDQDDNWTGLSSPVERRRRQNRLHQRRRKATSTASDVRVTQAGATATTSAPILLNQPQALVPIVPRKLIPPIIPYLTTATANKPIPPIILPLSADHHLLVLTQYNVLRATLTNMVILSLTDRLPLECRAALQIAPIPPPISMTSSLARSSVSSALQPTILQLTVPHDPFVDLIPFPPMRDNMIRLAGQFDEDALCDDVLGGLFEGFDDVEGRGILIWGEPWLEAAYEVSEGFAKKWGFLLKGCEALAEATSLWREARGEERLTVEV